MREIIKGTLVMLLVGVALTVIALIMTSCTEIASVDLPKWQDYTCVPVDSTGGWRCAVTETP